jgi:hypothetical protein
VKRRRYAPEAEDARAAEARRALAERVEAERRQSEAFTDKIATAYDEARVCLADEARRWTGPTDEDMAAIAALAPGEAPPVLPRLHWPYGPPSAHELCCVLHVGRGYCDCKASDEGDVEHGEGHHGTG